MDERIVIFNITLPYSQTELPISLMLARNYKKSDIVFLFEELENKGFGFYKRGTSGKGNGAKFIPNHLMPNSYTISFPKKSKITQGRIIP